MKNFFLIVACLLITSNLFAEIIYLKDGQIIKGRIIKETKRIVRIKTKYQTKQIRRSQIRRILYGNRDLEPIFILKKDGSKINGFLVDQDNRRVIIRKTKSDKKEIIIPKSSIKQMSQSDIIPVQPSIGIKVGMFTPLDSGGSNLNSSIIFIASLGFSLPITNVRFIFEGGYTKATSDDTDGLYLQIIPITCNLTYHFQFGSSSIVPKIGAGLAVVEFDDGDLVQVDGYDFIANAGLGYEYEVVERTLFLGLYADYVLIAESDASMHSIMVTGAIHYKF